MSEQPDIVERLKSFGLDLPATAKFPFGEWRQMMVAALVEIETLRAEVARLTEGMTQEIQTALGQFDENGNVPLRVRWVSPWKEEA